jgi:hypothetical protein
LNFVCICLNQIPEAIDSAARVLSKFSDDSSNLVVMMEASVGSVLEFFFKTCNYFRYSEDDKGASAWTRGASSVTDTTKQYNRDISAMGDCARVLGTMIKYNHPVKVHLPTLINVFWKALGTSTKRKRNTNKVTDDVHFLAELARLLYWELRRETDHVKTLHNAAEDSSVDHVLEAMSVLWLRCVETHTMLTANGGEFAAAVEIAAESDQALPVHLQIREEPFLDREDRRRYNDKNPLGPKEVLSKIHGARTLMTYVNCVLWILLPVPQLRWKMKDLGWQKLHYAFDLPGDHTLRIVLATVRFVVDLPHALESHQFFGFLCGQINDHLGQRAGMR